METVLLVLASVLVVVTIILLIAGLVLFSVAFVASRPPGGTRHAEDNDVLKGLLLQMSRAWREMMNSARNPAERRIAGGAWLITLSVMLVALSVVTVIAAGVTAAAGDSDDAGDSPAPATSSAPVTPTST